MTETKKLQPSVMDVSRSNSKWSYDNVLKQHQNVLKARQLSVLHATEQIIAHFVETQIGADTDVPFRMKQSVPITDVKTFIPPGMSLALITSCAWDMGWALCFYNDTQDIVTLEPVKIS